MSGNPERTAPMEELVHLMEESLAYGKSVSFTPTGYSMLPMLRPGKDSVVLSPITGRLKKYDLPLYRRTDGSYVLHRVVGVGETYTCCGDHQYILEKGITDAQLIAAVTRFHRGDKTYSVDSFGYRLYCRVWHCTRSLRRVLYRPLREVYHYIKK